METEIPFFAITIAFVVFNYIFEIILDIRQHRRFCSAEKPAELIDLVTDEDFQNAQQYGRAVSKFGFVTTTFEFVETFLILLVNGIAFLWDLSGSILNHFGYDESYEIIQSMVFILLYQLYSIIVHTPFSMFSTFSIEARFGFNNSDIKTFVMDKLKHLMLGIGFGLPVLAFTIHLIKWGGEFFWFWVWSFLLVIMLFLVAIYPTFIAPLFNKFEPLADGELRTQIQELASRLHFPLSQVYIVDGSTRSNHSNAYFFGLFKSKRIVLFDTLVNKMNNDEILSVLAHELGHWKYSHTIHNLIVSELNQLTLLFMFGQFLHNKKMYYDFGFHSQPVLIGLACFVLFLSPLQHILNFGLNALSRKFEFQADQFASDLGYDLEPALIKLQVDNKSCMSPDPLYSAYHFSHPHLIERLKALRAHSKKKQ